MAPRDERLTAKIGDWLEGQGTMPTPSGPLRCGTAWILGSTSPFGLGSEYDDCIEVLAPIADIDDWHLPR